MMNVLRSIEENYRLDMFPSKEELHKYIVDSVKMHKKTIELSRVYSSNKLSCNHFIGHLVISCMCCRFSEIVQGIYNDCFFFVTVLVLLCLSVGTIDVRKNSDLLEIIVLIVE